MHSWVPSPFTWNYHHIVNHLYSNTKYNVYKKKKSSIYTTVNIYCMLPVFGTLSIIFLKRWKYCFCFKNSLKWKSTSTINNRSKQKMKSNSVIWKSLSIYGKECQGHISMLKRFFYMSKYFQGPDAYCLSWIKSLEQKYYAFKKKLFGQVF